MREVPILQEGDKVALIAPASRASDQELLALQHILESWGLECIIHQQLFGADLLCANTDEVRAMILKNLLVRDDIKALICVRGGYGSMRIIPELISLPSSLSFKLLIGMSDITALNLFFMQNWGWPVIHGALNTAKFSADSIQLLRKILFGENREIIFKAQLLNKPLMQKSITSSLTGGNLCLVAASLGTPWQIQGKNKIIFLEEIGERGYRVDRLLEQLKQAQIFTEASAIVFGDFTEGNEPDGSSLLDPVIKRFAHSQKIPVLKIQGVGHDYVSHPLPLGTLAEIKWADEIQLRSTTFYQ